MTMLKTSDELAIDTRNALLEAIKSASGEGYGPAGLGQLADAYAAVVGAAEAPEAPPAP